MLTNTLRKLIHKAYADGQSVKDIAFKLNLTSAAVKEALDQAPKRSNRADKNLYDARLAIMELVREGYDLWVIYANFMDMVTMDELVEARSGAA